MLNKRRAILGYSVVLNPSLISEKVNKTIFIKFKFSSNIRPKVERLEKYTFESPSCIFSARLEGEYDWVCHFVFSSFEEFDFEVSSFLSMFSDLIADFRCHESRLSKFSPYTLTEEQNVHDKKLQVYTILNNIKKYDQINDRFQATVESLVNYFDIKFAILWTYEKRSNDLILRYLADKGRKKEMKITNPLNVRSVLQLRRPIVSNDAMHDPRLDHDWTKEEKLRSFCVFPIMYETEIVAVLAIFSERNLSPGNFEISSIFAEYLSKEISSFFSMKNLLSYN